MGQARLRGDYETRKAEGVKKRAIATVIRHLSRQQDWGRLTKEQKAEAVHTVLRNVGLG